MPNIKLEELILCSDMISTIGDLDLQISHLSQDSRDISNSDGTLFFAIEGARNDGHNFIPELISSGVKAFVISKDVEYISGISYLKVPDVRKAAADMACKFYSDPTSSMTILGVTGTKGKTTTTKMISAILSEAQKPAGLIGTIENVLPKGNVVSAKNTTPDAIELQSLFYQMKSGGFEYGVMEVSSHAIALDRIAHVDFDVAVLTNITSDHMDFHNSIDEYIETKAEFFLRLGAYGKKEGKIWPKVAILNADDKNFKIVEQHAKKAGVKIYTYACDHEADFKASNIDISDQGLRFILEVAPLSEKVEISSPLVGKFNVYNIMASVASCITLGLKLDVIKEKIAMFSGVPGRFQRLEGKEDFSVIVDYAHTEDSLKNVLITARGFTKGQLITVFGCGGDRDKTKRPKMGAVASKLSDFTILTSDNPRSENPFSILEDIKSGIVDGAEYIAIPNRQEAIREAISMAKPGDTIVIAGKGHETYQIFENETIHFDDMEEAKKAIADLRRY